ncbi:hypothetical protein Tco_0069643, partial [Tanacetum coccineum]
MFFRYEWSSIYKHENPTVTEGKADEGYLVGYAPNSKAYRVYNLTNKRVEERGCEDFTDILGYLDHSPLRYALTHAPPVIFDSLVKQFWATAVVRPNTIGSHDLVATIDDREVVVTESLIQTQLHFDDANGIFDMPIPNILKGMRVIGYPTDGTLTFLKNRLSPQWRFLVHTLMHCLSPKSGSWNQFP